MGGTGGLASGHFQKAESLACFISFPFPFEPPHPVSIHCPGVGDGLSVPGECLFGSLSLTNKGKEKEVLLGWQANMGFLQRLACPDLESLDGSNRF